MQDVLTLEADPRETKKDPISNLTTWGISFLCWASPIIGLSIFFPIGVIILYPTNRKLRTAAFLSLILQLIINIMNFPIDLLGLYSFETESLIYVLKQSLFGYYILFWALVGLIFIISEARFVLRKTGELNLFQESPTKVQQPIINRSINKELMEKWEDFEYHRVPRTPVPNADTNVTNSGNFFRTLFYVFIVWVIAILWHNFLSYLFVALNGTNFNPDESVSLTDQMFRGENSLYLWFMILISSTSIFGKKGVPAVFRKIYLGFYVQQKLALRPTHDFFGSSYANKKKYARIREMILPGWGHIYLQRYWKGFPILFTFLLVFFFFSVSVAFYMDASFGIKFLSFFGLKPGISDKEFLSYTDNIIFPIILFFILALIHIVANSLILNSIRKDGEPIDERGLQSGFSNNLYLSILVHLILFAVIFIIPISVQRQSSQKKRDMSKTHYQPEKMEYYFIDPDIPDEVKDLNGGVMAGTETPSKKDGIKIPDNPVEDEGKVKGYVKRVKGKKLPRTYSNYISARMRGPENFMNYWKLAPHPYSCVVAYTITTEGDIIDVILVEGSAYPDQDELTLELIKSMSPVMPPPNVKGDVRVTELFWNGTIDPDAMPTPLQKEMVLHFDGRFMEEDF